MNPSLEKNIDEDMQILIEHLRVVEIEGGIHLRFAREGRLNRGYMRDCWFSAMARVGCPKVKKYKLIYFY